MCCFVVQNFIRLHQQYEDSFDREELDPNENEDFIIHDLVTQDSKIATRAREQIAIDT